MSLPEQVREVTDTYLRLVDAAVPDLVQGLYLHGSTALGDFSPGHSDIDFVALTSHRPDEAEIGALAAVHEELDRLHPRPYFDGAYLLPADLAADPDRCPDIPGCHETRFEPSGRIMVSLVTWHELAEHGVAVRGPAIAELGVWTDEGALLANTRNNLRTYWKRWVDKLDELAEKEPDRAVDPWFVEWCVLGSVRLHALLVTGRLHSKGGAGRWAVRTGAFGPRWVPILTEALRIRSNDDGPPTYGDLRHRLRDTRDFLATVVAANET
ncbi:nucleotidyltransferase domain-containing protein [Actinopolymorpha sp. NPDC004070]|uniref:nucleotidyltransferase domain-containing protein n=1 Tax=Actinopolymorpha sp. NPDC004070 TaxID=3154548 RepID=UPI0033BA355E